MGWDIEPMEDITITSADKTHKLHVLGQTAQHVEFTFGGNPYFLRFLVIDNMQSQFNISAPFMRKIGACISFGKNIFTDNATFSQPLQTSSGKKSFHCQLLKGHSKDATVGPRLPVRLKRTVSVPARAMQLVQLEIDKAVSKELPPGTEWLLEGTRDVDERGLFTTTAAVVADVGQRQINAMLLNTAADEQEWAAGAIYGYVRQVTLPKAKGRARGAVSSSRST
jgi:hypothetical protein